jgi:hypothetical protein
MVPADLVVEVPGLDRPVDFDTIEDLNEWV